MYKKRTGPKLYTKNWHQIAHLHFFKICSIIKVSKFFEEGSLMNNYVIVSYDGHKFSVYDPTDVKSVNIDELVFHSAAFKYEGEFKRRMLQDFPGKTDWMLLPKATKRISEILTFNRVDF